MESLGSLEVGSTYSIFMPLAMCDLDQYMERYPEPSTQSAQKAALLQRAIGLAGAIVFLHEELESPHFERLSCFHMDLKPQNILVVIDTASGQQLWKLSDFNMSRIKMGRRHEDQLSALTRAGTFDIDGFFRRQISNNATSINDPTINRRGAGTYLAPEACIEGHLLQAESDIWSLGCVLTVVFTYLYGGDVKVKEFMDLRLEMSQDRSDRFCTTSRPAPRSPDDYRLNRGVKNWLRELEDQQNRVEEDMMKVTMRFLENEVLVIDPSRRQRTKAQHIRRKLIEAFKVYQNLNVSDDRVAPPIRPPRRSWWSRTMSCLRPSSPNTDIHSLGQGIRFETISTLSVFGPDARPLICVSGRYIVAYAAHRITTADDMAALTPSGAVSPNDQERLWSKNVAVSAQFVLAATDHETFEVSTIPRHLTTCIDRLQCYFYEISRPESARSELKLSDRWNFLLPKIIKLAISPDSTYAAFIVQGNSIDTERAVLYITRLNFPPR